MDPYRRSQRRTALALLVLYGIAAFAIVACFPPARAAGPDAPTVNQPRICAAAAVYTQAIADDWAQRAAIARATLNQYQGAASPSCGERVARILRTDFSPRLWQHALDVVDAVVSGSYWLPQSCTRANRVVPPSAAVGPGSQCVIAGLAFVEVQP